MDLMKKPSEMKKRKISIRKKGISCSKLPKLSVKKEKL